MPDHPSAPEALPSKPLELHVLLVLLERDMHGYALVRKLEERLPERGKILPGALYRTLHRMADLGWIEESDWRPDPAIDDQRRRYFRIAERGIEVARAEARRMQSLVEESRAKDLLAPRRS
jgi:DNA-binding PadR family transcriptional regulator